MPPRKKTADRLAFRILSFLAGLAIFYYSIQYFGGFHVVLAELLKLPLQAYVFVIGNSLLWTLSYTKAWKYLMTEQSGRIRFFSLFKVKASGEAVNLMTPAGFIVGDPVRVLLLKKYVGGEHARLRSVVVDRALHSLAAQFFCFLGLLLIFTQDVDFPIWLNCLLLGIYLVAFLGIGSLILNMLNGRGLGFFEPLFRQFKIERRLPGFYDKIETLRRELLFYVDKPKLPFLFSFLYHFAGRVLGAVELSVALYYLVGDFSWIFSIILTALTSFVSVIGGFIPGAMGFLEILYASFAKLYGYDPAMGLTIQIVRRLRIFFWIAVGILILDYGEITEYMREVKEKRKERNRERV